MIATICVCSAHGFIDGVQEIPVPSSLRDANFLTTALAMPIGASLAHYEALAAPAQGEVKITAIKTIRLNPRAGEFPGP